MSGWDAYTWPQGGPPPSAAFATAAELEQLHLRVLEQSLADVRRLLARAGRLATPHRREVQALGALAADVHHQVLKALARE